MAKIHWIVYVLVGLFVSIASWKIDKERFIFFFYSGFVFVFIGIVKLIFSLIKRKMSKPKAVHPKAHHQAQHIKYCHQCGARLDLHHKFCTKCGARI